MNLRDALEQSRDPALFNYFSTIISIATVVAEIGRLDVRALCSVSRKAASCESRAASRTVKCSEYISIEYIHMLRTYIYIHKYIVVQLQFIYNYSYMPRILKAGRVAKQ